MLPRYFAMEQGGWLDMRSVIGYTHDVPEYRRELVVGMDDFVASRLLRDDSSSARKKPRDVWSVFVVVVPIGRPPGHPRPLAEKLGQPISRRYSASGVP